MMARLSARPSTIAPLAAGLLLACGGAEADRPEPPAAVSGEALDACVLAEQRDADGWEFQSLVDFEPTDDTMPSKLRPECAATTPCGFYFNYDTLLTPIDPPVAGCDLGEGVVLELNQTVGPPFAYPIPDGRCGSSAYAYHLQAKNLATCVSERTGRQGWGATLALTLNANPQDSGQALEAYDASEWDGISLWVRLGETPSHRAILTAAKDPYTSRPPADSEQEQYCSTADGVADAKKCDAFGLAVLLEPEWRFVTVPFSLMQQKGFGTPSPLGALQASELVGLELGFGAGDWDAWVDDVAFYREPR